MEKMNQIVPGKSPCDTGGRTTARIAARKALARGETGAEPATLKSFTAPLEPLRPAAARRPKCR